MYPCTNGSHAAQTTVGLPVAQPSALRSHLGASSGSAAIGQAGPGVDVRVDVGKGLGVQVCVGPGAGVLDDDGLAAGEEVGEGKTGVEVAVGAMAVADAIGAAVAPETGAAWAV